MIRPPGPRSVAPNATCRVSTPPRSSPGPAGYDAAFAIRTSDVPELSEIKFATPIEVQISGSALLYDLDTPIAAEGQPVPSLEEEFPGIRRTILEHHLRYTFVRFGVPYVVSVICFDAGVSRYKMPTCRAADQIALRFLRALRVVGGKPHSLRAARALPVERPVRVSHSFGYDAPGQLLSGSSFRGQGGNGADYTVYSQIRFPLADAPAYVNSRCSNAAAASTRQMRTIPDLPQLPGATISANGEAFRSVSVLPELGIRAKTSVPAHASRRLDWSAARIVAISLPSATVSFFARPGRRLLICSSTRPTSTSGFAICT